MLTDKLREGATGPIAKIIFGLIILSFVIAGVGTYLMPRVNLNPVKVNGTSITSGELEQQFRIKRNSLERQLGQQYVEQTKNPEFLNSLRNDVLEQMINDGVVSDHIYKSGIVVNDALVKSRIVQMPEFKVDGKFNQSTYNKVLSRAGYTPDLFGEALRGDIAREIYLKTVLDGQFALPYEVSREAAMLTEERTFKKIDIDLSTFEKDVKVSDDEINAYYAEHKNDYLLPEEIKISYIYLQAADLEKDVKYTEDDLKKFFNLHAELYTVPEKRVVSHILLTGDDAEVKIKELKKQLDEGASFEELAKKNSQDDTSAAQGGKLPAFSLGNMDASFEKAAFGLAKVGDVSAPVNSQYGWHLIKLDGIEPQYNREFNDVKNDVIAKYVKQQSKELFDDKRQILADTSFENPDSLDAAIVAANASKVEGEAPSTSVKQTETKLFALDSDSLEFPLNDEKVKSSIKSYIASILKDISLPKDASAQSVEDEFLKYVNNSDVIDLGSSALVLYHINAYKEPTAKKLEDVKALITAAIVNKKAIANCQSLVKDVMEALNKGESIDGFIKDKKIKVGENIVYSRLTNDADPAVMTNVFEMPKAPQGKYTAKDFVDDNGNPYILVLSDVKLPNAEKDDGRDSFLNTQISNVRMMEDNILIIKAARADSVIEYNTDREYKKMLDNQSID